MIGKILLETLNSINQKRWAIIKTLLPYLIILMLIDELTRFLAKSIAEHSDVSFEAILVFIALFITFVISFLIAVKTHRILLLDEDEIPDSEFYNIGFKEFKFLFASIILTLIVGAICVIFGLVFKLLNIQMAVGILLGALISSFVVARLSLVLPSISIEEDISFRESWELSKEYKFIIFFIIVLYPVIISLVLGLTYGFAIKFLSALLDINLDILMVLLNVCITVLIIGGLSVLYRLIIAQNQEVNYEVVEVEPTEDA